MPAAASIKVMDALFGFLARNDVEWTKRELLGRSYGVEIGACANFDPKTLFWGTGNNYGEWMLGEREGGRNSPWDLTQN